MKRIISSLDFGYLIELQWFFSSNLSHARLTQKYCQNAYKNELENRKS